MWTKDFEDKYPIFYIDSADDANKILRTISDEGAYKKIIKDCQKMSHEWINGRFTYEALSKQLEFDIRNSNWRRE